jgi:hypothetical protein
MKLQRRSGASAADTDGRYSGGLGAGLTSGIVSLLLMLAIFATSGQL